jgi:transposase
MNLTTLGIDLAKTSLSLVGMDDHGKVMLRKTLKREALMSFVAQCPPCVRLGRITKQGDSYLRMCLVHGARSVIANLKNKQDKVSCWIRQLIERRGYLRAVVAVAARNARMIWTLLVKQEDYKVMSV